MTFWDGFETWLNVAAVDFLVSLGVLALFIVGFVLYFVVGRIVHRLCK